MLQANKAGEFSNQITVYLDVDGVLDKIILRVNGSAAVNPNPDPNANKLGQ